MSNGNIKLSLALARDVVAKMLGKTITFKRSFSDKVFDRQELVKTFTRLDQELPEDEYDTSIDEFYNECCDLFDNFFIDHNRSVEIAAALGATPSFMQSIIDKSCIILTQPWYPDWLNAMISNGDYVVFVSKTEIYATRRNIQSVYLTKFNKVYHNNIIKTEGGKRFIDFIKFIEGNQVKPQTDDLVLFSVFAATLGATSAFCNILVEHISGNKFEKQTLWYKMVRDLGLMTEDSKIIADITIEKYYELGKESDSQDILEYVLDTIEIEQEVNTTLTRFVNKEIEDINITVINNHEYRKHYLMNPSSELGKYIGMKLEKFTNKVAMI